MQQLIYLTIFTFIAEMCKVVFFKVATG